MSSVDELSRTPQSCLSKNPLNSPPVVVDSRLIVVLAQNMNLSSWSSLQTKRFQSQPSQSFSALQFHSKAKSSHTNLNLPSLENNKEEISRSPKTPQISKNRKNATKMYKGTIKRKSTGFSDFQMNVTTSHKMQSPKVKERVNILLGRNECRRKKE